MIQCPYGSEGNCAECEDTNQPCHPEHGRAQLNLERRLSQLEDRVRELEAKEDQRSRNEHQRELSFDEWAEGSAIIAERKEGSPYANESFLDWRDK